jgi:hypothetical protein
MQSWRAHTAGALVSQTPIFEPIHGGLQRVLGLPARRRPPDRGTDVDSLIPCNVGSASILTSDVLVRGVG